MANKIICVIAMVILAFLVSVAFYQQAMSTGFNSSMTITRSVVQAGIIGQKMVAVKHHHERIPEVGVTYPTGDQTLREIDEGSSYQGRSVRQVEVNVSDSQKRGSRISFTQRKLKLEFQPERDIPGGPDGQHH